MSPPVLSVDETTLYWRCAAAAAAATFVSDVFQSDTCTHVHPSGVRDTHTVSTVSGTLGNVFTIGVTVCTDCCDCVSSRRVVLPSAMSAFDGRFEDVVRNCMNDRMDGARGGAAVGTFGNGGGGG
jgi:hypothetical protein